VTDKDSAYIAGFLDGDGCIMLQLVYRKDYLLGYQIRASIVFYQNQQNSQFLAWLKKKLTHGYIRNRKDGITEYTILGIKPVGRILKILKPYLKLKKKQASLALKILSQMPGSGKQMTPQLLLKLAREVDKFADLNYSKKRTNTSQKVEEFLKSRFLL
jgi:hypothetical protein